MPGGRPGLRERTRGCRRYRQEGSDHVANRTDAAGRARHHPHASPLHPARDSGRQIGARIMNFIIWLIVGGVIGWLASMLMRTNDQQGMLLNVIVGIVGAMLGGWFISPLVGVATINQNNFSLPALLVSFIGAAILLAIVNLFRRRAVTR
jgi:uncharacterized membrane protein YeaQ/YmgE (transglycosylase-associated protein family)